MRRVGPQRTMRDVPPGVRNTSPGTFGSPATEQDRGRGCPGLSALLDGGPSARGPSRLAGAVALRDLAVDATKSGEGAGTASVSDEPTRTTCRKWFGSATRSALTSHCAQPAPATPLTSVLRLPRLVQASDLAEVYGPAFNLVVKEADVNSRAGGDE